MSKPYPEVAVLICVCDDCQNEQTRTLHSGFNIHVLAILFVGGPFGYLSTCIVQNTFVKFVLEYQ